LFFFSEADYSKHYLIRQIFCYIGTTFLSIIFYFIGIKRSKLSSDVIEKKKDSTRERGFSTIVYIHSKNTEKIRISYSFFVLIIFLWIFLEQAIERFSTVFPHMDFWMIELIIITFLNKKIFNNEIYRHHLFVIFLNFFPTIFKVITIILSFQVGDSKENQNQNQNQNQQYLYVKHFYLLFIGIIIYMILITSRAYVNIRLKCFMDLKYISPNKLLINYGLLGTLFYTAICTFTTFVKCDSSKDNNVYDYICPRKENDTSNDKYFESFSLYFNTSDEVKDIIIEILTVILGTMFSYCHKYFL
jgi:hypothetical protein